MSDTTFQDFVTPVVASWAQDINNHVYRDTPIAPATTVHSALHISNTPAGNIIATNAQAALNELDTKKVSLTQLSASSGSSLVGFLQGGIGAVSRTIQSREQDFLSAKDFGAVGDGIVDDSAALQAMFNTGGHWTIPPGNYKISTALTITSSGECYGTLVAAAGFAGRLVSIVNPTYGQKLTITGLSTYSTDVRPSPYGAGATTGIFVGPNATYLGVTPCPNVNLIGCKATRFSIGAQISSFNITAFGCEFFQNDHNLLVFTADTTFNQVNDVSIINCDLNSATSGVGQAYALRVGTTGNATYTPNSSMGVNLMVQGCNSDGAPVYLDNIIGVTYQQNYHEQAVGYTYTGAAIVLGSAGANYLQDTLISNCYFTNFNYGIDAVTSVLNLDIKPNFYGSIVYSALRIYTTEAANGIRYINGIAGGSTNWTIGSGAPEVCTNYSGGIAIGQLTFGGLSIKSEFLDNSLQVVPTQSYTTSWYPNGITLDGWKNISSSVGRFHTGAAIQSSIAGTQSGANFTFTTLAQAKLFNGGDRISGTGAAAAATFIKSINYATGVAVLDSSGTGAATISNTAASFLGYNLSGTGSPNTVVTAIPGSLYVNLSGGAATTLYVKESGTGNTGWVGK